MALALRRNMGNGSSASLGAAILDDVSAGTVLKAEREAGAALRCTLRAHILEEETRASLMPGMTISSVAFSSDATNSAVWQHSKLQVCEVKTSHIQVGDLTEHREFLSCITCRSGWSDIGVVLYPTAGGTHSLLLKQLKSVGCLTWLDLVGNGPGDAKHIRWFLYVSDGGPDQVSFAKHLIQQTQGRLQILAVTSRCYMHVLQLMFRSGLQERLFYPLDLALAKGHGRLAGGVEEGISVPSGQKAHHEAKVIPSMFSALRRGAVQKHRGYNVRLVVQWISYPRDSSALPAGPFWPARCEVQGVIDFPLRAFGVGCMVS
jgi:hypothetical protein